MKWTIRRRPAPAPPAVVTTSATDRDSWRNLARLATDRAARLADAHQRLTAEAAVLAERHQAAADALRAEHQRAERYRLAWHAARRRATGHRVELECQQRAADRLGEQLLAAMGYPDTARAALGLPPRTT
ncbi:MULTISPECIES: hypothetical protein [Streptomycetaceae]|uniref:Uncharacterized protein n=1 Tax=Streptantibioticus cattleyicolor (strain ATCC 35852 / DSM 46488 / JCM 4925 / NBRC 14057 / NRRL 8057) TaxID=1003195 RepID=F8JY66_STREN|nr:MULTISPECIES: hypothetical protein [Streptomycetaceae]AEW94642.1 hypothetical protein SCATT_22710 [Streptantibioticus cattleyicolor NRRL 8057 = DSM 46488]MYS59280.1 hypothetical protein [Streptomyces sp. SID5468]CCB74999.1 protein of unknown function [Streptantibioticus cattleyicolor NRRL 8057 = DSM 46488]